MKTLKTAFLLLFILLLQVTAYGAVGGNSPFQLRWDANPSKLDAGQKFYFTVNIRAPEGYYIYADDTEVDFESLEGLIVSDIDYPKTKRHEDKFTGKMVDVYEGDISIGIAGYVPEDLDAGIHELSAQIKFKGCSPSLCFRPEAHLASFVIDVGGPLAGKARGVQKAALPEPPIQKNIAEMTFKGLFHITDFGALLQRGIGMTLIIVFLAGVLTSLTPCVWPVIPAVLLFVGVHPHKKFSENVLLAFCLTLGIVLIYSILGISAVAFGRNLGFLFQYRWFISLVVLFFVLMSLSMFGLFDLRMPRKWHTWAHKLGGEGYRGAFLAGLGLGLVASPCAGPVLAALLGYVALQGDYLKGFGLLLVYSFGFGLLFVFLGGFYAEIAHKLRGGPWLVWVRRVLGIILLFPAAFYMGSLFNWGGSDVPEGPRIEWIVSDADAIRFARMTGRPVMIEFTADWCPPCLALEKHFFTKPDIIRLSYRLVPVRVDATKENKYVARLTEEYDVVGWPTILFLSPDGKPYKDLRVSDYDPDMIRKHMKEAILRAGEEDDGKGN